MYLKHHSYRSVQRIQSHLAKDETKCLCLFSCREVASCIRICLLIALFTLCFQTWFPKGLRVARILSTNLSHPLRWALPALCCTF